MLFGQISPIDNPVGISQGTCPAGFAYDPNLGLIGMAFPCTPVENTQSTPGGIIETNPTLLPALPLSNKMIAAAGVVGAIVGLVVGFIKR